MYLIFWKTKKDSAHVTFLKERVRMRALERFREEHADEFNKESDPEVYDLENDPFLYWVAKCLIYADEHMRGMLKIERVLSAYFTAVMWGARSYVRFLMKPSVLWWRKNN